MNEDHAAATQSAETMKRPATPARPTAYDKALAFKICDRFGKGARLEAILAEPGMPDEHTFSRWLMADSDLANRFCEKEQLLETLVAMQREHEAEEKERLLKIKCRAREWPQIYPLIGPPPVLSTESKQDYDELLTACTELLQPQDIMGQIFVKQVVDATWEEARCLCEKTRRLEPEHQDYLEVQPQRQNTLAKCTAGGGSGDGSGPACSAVQQPEVISTKPATALDHARGFEKRFRYYQILDRQQMQAARRRALALRELERWNKGVARRVRELSQHFIWADEICPPEPPARAASRQAPVTQLGRA